MKCPKCRHDMEYITDGDHNFWWKCPECQTEVGKREENNESIDNNSDIQSS